MKVFLLIILSFVFIPFVDAQEIEEITLDSSSRTNYLYKVFNLHSYCVFPMYDDGDTVRSFMATHEQKFQFYLSDATDTLLVFDGKLCGGHEMGVVNTYKFIDGKPETIIARSGKIANRQNDTLWIHTYPCCAQVLNIIVPFSLRTGEKLGTAHVFYTRYDYSAIFPLKERAKQNYQLAEDVDVRWSPSSEESMIPHCGSRETIVLHASKGTNFTLIDTFSNDWALIRFDTVSVSNGFCIGEYHQRLIDSDKFILYGWIPAKKVRQKKC